MMDDYFGIYCEIFGEWTSLYVAVIERKREGLLFCVGNGGIARQHLFRLLVSSKRALGVQ